MNMCLRSSDTMSKYREGATELAHLSHHGVLSSTVCRDHLRRRSGEAKAQPGKLPGACDAAKVYDCPAVLAGQPHHFPGLEVAVHVS